MHARNTDVPDALWELIEPFFLQRKANRKGGRPRTPDRIVLAGIMYKLRTGCQWKAIPIDFGSGSTCHRRFGEWARRGIFNQIYKRLLRHYDDRVGIDWLWTALDGVIVKAPKGGTSPGQNPTDRAKSGCKRHIVTDAYGIPVGVVISGANVPDMRMALNAIDDATRRAPRRRPPINCCLDKGYDYKSVDVGLRRRAITGTRGAAASRPSSVEFAASLAAG